MRIVNELADDPEVQLRPVEGWRSYLTGVAHGVRRYARAHPHAFPWPLCVRRGSVDQSAARSLRWVEAMPTELASEGFADDEVLFT
jgi:TetR/AcrR family tetracycline transcriptional repressor